MSKEKAEDDLLRRSMIEVPQEEFGDDQQMMLSRARTRERAFLH